MNLPKSISYIGVNDHNIDLFEGQYDVPNGMAYNSYVVSGEKTAVMDTVDAHFGKMWLENLKKAVGTKTPDYLVVQHMEPDHSANIALFCSEYPNAKIVATAAAFKMMQQFFGKDFSDRAVVITEGAALELGGATLRFYLAPMVHWPEVAVTYYEEEQTLFSADGFGKFGALDIDEEWACEARRYYFGIVGKYGVQVQALLKKVNALKIARICPLHGPVLDSNLEYYLGLYNTWSSYMPENRGVLVAYASVYGNTKKAAEELCKELEDGGCEKVVLCDLCRCDMAEAVEDAFRYDRLALASVTYNGELFPFMRNFLADLTERGFKNRTVGIIENGSWAPTAAKHIKKAFENSKNITVSDTVVTVKSALNDDSRAAVKQLASELLKA